jgi:hypothetical protein
MKKISEVSIRCGVAALEGVSLDFRVSLDTEMPSRGKFYGVDDVGIK